MKPKPSPLNILDISLTRYEYNFTPPQTDTDVKALFESYELDIDFTIHHKEYIRVLVKVDINRGEKKLPGYSIFAEVLCIFEFDKNMQVTEDVKKAMEGFSTLYIALNNLRSFVLSMTGSAPMSSYILPSIDLNELIQQKKNKLLEKANNNMKKAVKKE